MEKKKAQGASNKQSSTLPRLNYISTRRLIPLGLPWLVKLFESIFVHLSKLEWMFTLSIININRTTLIRSSYTKKEKLIY